jgi:hypothetical protein
VNRIWNKKYVSLKYDVSETTYLKNLEVVYEIFHFYYTTAKNAWTFKRYHTTVSYVALKWPF